MVNGSTGRYRGKRTGHRPATDMSGPAPHSRPPALLILTALAVEAAALGNSRLPATATPEAEQVRIVQCGVGCQAVLTAAHRHLPGCAIVGSMGISGGLSPDLQPGTIVLGERILGRHPAMGSAWPCDPDLVDLLEERLHRHHVPCHRGPLLCVADPLLTPAEKTTALRRTGALAVDMESAAAARAAQDAGLPFFSLRVICDPAGRRLAPELLAGVDPQGNSRPGRLLVQLLRRPWLLPRFLAMVRDFSLARRSLRRSWRILRDPLAARASTTRTAERDPQRLQRVTHGLEHG